MASEWLFQYPVWNLEFWGGGLLIILMAVIHVYIAHFAVGGGLFLVLTEQKALREHSSEMLDYVKTHTRFFLLLTMVFGGITGVGIWFTISLISPAATSVLVHSFAFGWATEWVFFVGEIVTLFVYFYTFGKMNSKNHLKVGWLYFIFGWLSLVVINGIVGFMLTPGTWLETKDFWDGMFNPSFFPSLVFRTAIAFMLAGLFGFLTSVAITNPEFRQTMLRYCSKWVVIPFAVLVVSGWWYLSAIPEPQKSMILSNSPEILPFLKTFLWLSPIIVIGSLLMSFRSPALVQKLLAGGLILVGLLYLGSFEWIREAGRRPYILYGYMFSNSTLAGNGPKSSGILASARWVKHREITDKNQVEAGQEIFRLMCLSCHSVGGPISDILPLTAKYSLVGMESFIDGIGKISEYMPPFIGNASEKKALAAYLINGLHQKSELTEPIPDPIKASVDIPAFDPQTAEYVLLAWSGQGMAAMSDCDEWFKLREPNREVYALLIRRGETPERMIDRITISWRMVQGVGKAQSVEGTMNYDSRHHVFKAAGVPVTPYPDEQSVNPYPLVVVEAKDAETGRLLASAKTSVPISTELGCKTCHGGSWRVGNVAGIDSNTAKDILRVHDRIHRTNLLKSAENGTSQSCLACHGNGQQDSLNLSAAIHGFHAHYLSNRNEDACLACHPGAGYTKGLRGVHLSNGLDCTNCHGKLEDHALSLLMGEKKAGNIRADRLMTHLKPRSVNAVEDIAPRLPYIHEPDCLNCHVDFKSPDTDTSELNLRTKSEAGLYHVRSDDAGVACAACHGPVHAEYPAANFFGVDNLMPMQYQQNSLPIGAKKNCSVCHQTTPEESVHHPHMDN